MSLSDPFFVFVFSVFAADIIGPRAWQFARWYRERYYEDAEDEG